MISTFISFGMITLGLSIIVQTFKAQGLYKKFDTMFPVFKDFPQLYKKIILILVGIISIGVGIFIKFSDFNYKSPLGG